MTKYCLRGAWSVVLLAALSGACATSVPFASPEMDMQVKSMSSPRDKALLYVYRWDTGGRNRNFIINMNGQHVGDIAIETFIVLLMEPGMHELEMSWNYEADRYKKSKLVINAEAGKAYYVSAEIQRFTDNMLLTTRSSNQSIERIKNHRLALIAGYENDRIMTVAAKYREPTQVTIRSRSEAPAPPSTQIADDVRPAIPDVNMLPSLKIASNKKAYAIVVGIEQYRQKLPKADFAAQDAKLVADYLTKVLSYPEENVITLINDRALQSDMTKYFERWLSNNVESGSTVFVYYSGHGAPNPKTGDAYLVPYDGDPSFIDETGYSLKRLYSALGRLPAKEVIVALDSCFSGAGGRSVIATGSRPLVMNLQTAAALPQNVTVLSASAGDQTSSTYDEKGHGLFTYFFLKSIKYEDVVRPDGSLKVKDIYSYMKPQVESIARKKYNNEQTPQLIEAKK